jgi:hypothetical protein
MMISSLQNPFVPSEIRFYGNTVFLSEKEEITALPAEPPLHALPVKAAQGHS